MYANGKSVMHTCWPTECGIVRLRMVNHFIMFYHPPCNPGQLKSAIKLWVHSCALLSQMVIRRAAQIPDMGHKRIVARSLCSHPDRNRCWHMGGAIRFEEAIELSLRIMSHYEAIRYRIRSMSVDLHKPSFTISRVGRHWVNFGIHTKFIRP